METPREKMPCDDGGRGWSDASTSQGTPRTAGKRMLGEARRDSPLQISPALGYFVSAALGS